MIRKAMYEVHSYRRIGPHGEEVSQGTSGPFETRNTAERCAIAFAQSGQCHRTVIKSIVVEESEVCEHPASESCEKCTPVLEKGIPEPLTGVPKQVPAQKLDCDCDRQPGDAPCRVHGMLPR